MLLLASHSILVDSIYVIKMTLIVAAAADRLTKLSCHDSGIDIRESETIAPTRKTRSDADILLAGKDECVLFVGVPEPRSQEKEVTFNEDQKEDKEKDEKQAEAMKNKVQTVISAVLLILVDDLLIISAAVMDLPTGFSQVIYYHN